ncbi:two-component system phosphate regulon response regulator PhoB [Symbiobacterium terraclitae]|uniref:Stage 0 sporulation protein A homolog n=2 Tax=Symbiobacterium terraclitae TaxID=557451 RepID=A0ABS4JQE3_9FIRM|nr:response regulator [Symbiobacterium terraclitae]MBP2017756.1 two-component system phosphate regulon response regulator PhoB [Symbiobacterium terraclitae]
MPHILVADDDLDIARLVEFQLKYSGYQVTLAHDGNTALDRARAGRPDLILLDWMMPGLDGMECLTALKSDPSLRHIPVILMTARAQQGDVQAGIAAGATAYLVKPFDLEQLIHAVKEAVG